MAAKRSKTKKKKRTSRSRTTTTTTKKKKARKKTKAKAKAKPRAKAKAKAKTAKRAAPKQDAKAAPPELEEALAEPIADVSGVFRISEAIIKAQRGVDENESLQFKDPSLVIEIQRHERTIKVKDEDIVAEEPEDD